MADTKPSNDKMGVSGAVGCLIMLVLAGLAVWGGWTWVRSCGGEQDAVAARFEDHLAEYVALGSASSIGEASADSKGYLRGKLVMVSRETKELEGMFLDQLTSDDPTLPESLLARSPKEVETVVLVSWLEEVVGTYTDGAKAYRHDCWIIVADITKKTIVGMHTLKGSSPPEEKLGGGDEHGTPPSDDEVLDYLKSLPRR